MTSREYWARREAEQLLHNLSDEADAARRLDAIYRDMLDACQKEIESCYGKYASTEGITLAEAKKRVSELDIEAYARKAKRYVADKNFSDRANEELRLYNLTMKVNRLELLKANLGLELLRGYDELDAFLEEILQGRTLDELRRQAGILGETVRNNAKAASAIINASFHNATFSDRIWSNQSLLKIELDRLLQSGLIQGKNPRALARELRKKFDSSRYNAERLMRTELARVQTEAQKQSFLRNGFEYYEFVANGGCCDLCSALDGKHFRVRDMTPGENAPPMHPNCRCSTAAWEDSEEYEAWLDFLSRGGSTEEWNQRGKAEWLKKSWKVLEKSEKSSIIKNDNKAFSVNDKQFGKKVGRHAADFGFDPASEEDRAKLLRIIYDIRNNAEEQRIGPWRGQPEDVIFYLKGDDVVITRQNGEFVTILKGGISNERVKNARNK